MKTSSLPLLFLTTFTLLAASTTTVVADPLQTQPASSGKMEVDAIKASVKDGILTIQLAYRNKGSEDVNLYYGIEGVYYIDEKDKKKYHVLKDSKGTWIAAPLEGVSIVGPVKADDKTIVWFKFPAPATASTKVNLVVPGVLPFEDLPISQ